MRIKRKYTLRYAAELRYFDEFGDDYIHLEFKSRSRSGVFFQALNHHNKYFSDEKCKINVLDNNHPEHGVWIIESQIIPDKLTKFRKILTKQRKIAITGMVEKHLTELVNRWELKKIEILK